MNIIDRNCTFTLNMPIINIIDNRRQYQSTPITPSTTISTTQPYKVFNIQTFPNQNSNNTSPSSTTITSSSSSSTINDYENNNTESDLTELSWLTNNLDLLSKSFTLNNPFNTTINNNNHNTILKLNETIQKPIAQNEPPGIKQKNDNFIKLSTTQQKLSNTNNNLSNYSDLNGLDLESSFSSSTSSSSCSFTSNLNSSLENNENFAKISANLQNIFKQKQTEKSEHSYFNIHDRFNKTNNKAISSIKKIKLSEYYESKDILKTAISNDNKQISKPLISQETSKIEIDQQKNEQQNVNNKQNENNNIFNKPPLTLSCLIFMAIQESKYKCLPVREIYEWIETNFPFYKNAKTGWKSSIRHNLSFSKCFKKMDRLESCKFLTNNNQNSLGLGDNQNNSLKFKLPNKTISNYNQRSTYITGTCWQVNPECKSYLMQTLKKSTFWFKYNISYPNLTKLMQNYFNNEENLHQQTNIHHHHHHHQHRNKINKIEQVIEKTENNTMVVSSNLLIKEETNELKVSNEEIFNNNNSSSFNSSDNENDNYFDENDYEDTKSNINSLIINIDENDDDVTKAAEILYKNKNSLLFNNNNNCSTTAAATQSVTIPQKIFISNINSDLEIEVASTLVRLKSLIEIRS